QRQFRRVLHARARQYLPHAAVELRDVRAVDAHLVIRQQRPDPVAHVMWGGLIVHVEAIHPLRCRPDEHVIRRERGERNEEKQTEEELAQGEGWNARGRACLPSLVPPPSAGYKPALHW